MTVDECAFIVRELGELDIYTLPELLQWLQSPNKLLDGRMPIDCKVEDVLRLVYQLKDGAFV